MSSSSIIFGITGPFGSGKSTAADFLTQKGYKKIVLSQFLEEELFARGEKEITRQKLQDLGNEWRQEFGSSILAVKASEFIQKSGSQKIVVEGIRNVAEIEELKKVGNFTLVSLVINRDIRYNRLKNLGRRENLTPELFEELDNRDLGIGENESGLQVALCMAKADRFIENNKDLENLKMRLEELLRDIE